MATSSAANVGRGQTSLSLVIVVLGIAAVFLLAQLRPSLPVWLVIGAFIGGGLIGLISAAIGLIRGHGVTRWVAVAGALLNVLLILFGLLAWFFSQLNLSSVFT